MLRHLIAFFVIAVAVQVCHSQFEERKIDQEMDDMIKMAKNLLEVSLEKQDMASCVNQFNFVPTSKATIQKGEDCLSRIYGITYLLKTKLKDMRAKIVESVLVIGIKNHNIFDIIQLMTRSKSYFQLILARVESKDRHNYFKYFKRCFKRCVLPVLDEIKKNADDALVRVNQCYEKK